MRSQTHRYLLASLLIGVSFNGISQGLMLSLDRTYIRVRRKRSAAAAEAICMEGISTSADSGGSEDSVTSSRKRVAIWRRIDEPSGHMGARRREYRVLDAVLEEEDFAGEPRRDDCDDDNEYPAVKRRRLTFLHTSFTKENYRNDKSTLRGQPSTQSSRKGSIGTAFRILGPAERLVDDSLRQVFSGDLTVAQHFRFLSSDTRLADQFHRWCVWQNPEHGSLLHACAMWNDHEMVSEMLQVLMLQSGGTMSAPTRDYSFILDAIDGEGRTPYQLAEMSGHDLVCQILEAYGVCDYDSDLYALDDGFVQNYHEDVQSKDEGDCLGDSCRGNYLSCELQGALGYWDDSGQLILQPTPPHTTSNISLRDEDESIDSNHENWDGNDYPDAEGEGFFDEEFDDDSSGRGRGVYEEPTGFSGTRRPSPMGVVDTHGDFDAAYGIYDQADIEEYDYES